MLLPGLALPSCESASTDGSSSEGEELPVFSSFCWDTVRGVGCRRTARASPQCRALSPLPRHCCPRRPGPARAPGPSALRPHSSMRSLRQVGQAGTQRHAPHAPRTSAWLTCSRAMHACAGPSGSVPPPSNGLKQAAGTSPASNGLHGSGWFSGAAGRLANVHSPRSPRMPQQVRERARAPPLMRCCPQCCQATPAPAAPSTHACTHTGFWHTRRARGSASPPSPRAHLLSALRRSARRPPTPTRKRPQPPASSQQRRRPSPRASTPLCRRRTRRTRPWTRPRAASCSWRGSWWMWS